MAISATPRKPTRPEVVAEPAAVAQAVPVAVQGRARAVVQVLAPAVPVVAPAVLVVVQAVPAAARAALVVVQALVLVARPAGQVRAGVLELEPVAAEPALAEARAELEPVVLEPERALAEARVALALVAARPAPVVVPQAAPRLAQAERRVRRPAALPARRRPALLAAAGPARAAEEQRPALPAVRRAAAMAGHRSSPHAMRFCAAWRRSGRRLR